jgi:hypothetical protein
VIYPDLAFVLSLLVQGDQSQDAAQLLRDVTHPLPLSRIHQLQVENGLLRAFLGSNREQAEAARDGLLLWRQYLEEQIFIIENFDLDFAFAQAAAWNADFDFQPPRWSLLLHPAVALERQAAFLSFNPTLRKCAKKAGLKLLPEQL